MKTIKLLVVIVIFAIFVLFSCSEYSASSDTESPTVVIIYPPNYSEFVSGTIVNIIAEAEDNKEVDNVKLYIDGISSYEDSTEPYEYSWNTNDLNGPHTIYAKAFDTSGNSAISDIITVTVTEDLENSPNPPTNPLPSDNASSISVNTDLSWDCTDPDDDPLTYDVYFGTSSNPLLVNSGQSSTTYDPGTLNGETTYFWMIVANDNNTNSTTGDIWQFTTRIIYTGDFEWCDISAGDFTYGNPPQTQNISYDFQIMKYEITNQQFIVYLEEALASGEITVTSSTVRGYYPGDQHYTAGNKNFYILGTPYTYNYSRISWDGSSFIINVPSGYNAGDFDNHPVVYVTWFGGWAFAEHYGFSLPAEQEWEKAARGNTGYDWPWGNSFDSSRANCWWSYDPFEHGTTPVGYYNGDYHNGYQTTDSPSPYGAYDMAGNVWNWTDSFWSDTNSYRVLRGGSWWNDANNLRSWNRFYHSPGYNYHTFGFRCVRL
jgi:formylglycine-generating enzyme required for sulfatase activity